MEGMHSDETVRRVDIHGELTIFMAADLRQQLLDALAGGGDVDVDLYDVSEIDCAGVQLMISAQREAALLDKRLTFKGHSQAVVELLGLCNLSGQY